MFRSIVLLVGALASLSAVSLFAQEAVLTQEYGSGVHAYFTGDSQQAYESLTAAIQGGSKDPRAFYFRGLTYMTLGRPQEASIDFRKGAELESKDINRFYNVGKALERVQGAARIELEKYRVDARMIALEQAEKIRKARYEAMKREEERVLREQSVAAPEGSEVVPPPAAESDNPFAAPEATTKPATKNGAAKPAAKKAAGAEEDPFATPKADEKKKPEAKKPAVEKKSGDEDDPFGGSGDEKKKPDAKKAPAKPAKSPDKDDPFGN
jgi:tetratricopeptide (TPR) repeat protein